MPECEVFGCTAQAKPRGRCPRHYARAYRLDFYWMPPAADALRWAVTYSAECSWEEAVDLVERASLRGGGPDWQCQVPGCDELRHRGTRCSHHYSVARYWNALSPEPALDWLRIAERRLDGLRDKRSAEATAAIGLLRLGPDAVAAVDALGFVKRDIGHDALAALDAAGASDLLHQATVKDVFELSKAADAKLSAWMMRAVEAASSPPAGSVAELVKTWGLQ